MEHRVKKQDDASANVYQLEQLRRAGAQKARPRLSQALTDRNSEVRFRAVERLGELKIQAALLPLLEHLRQDRSPLVRLAAAESLGCLRSKKALQGLVSALTDKDELVRGYAAEAIARIGDRTCAPILRRSLRKEQHPAARVRLYAAGYRLGDVTMLTKLMNMLHHRSYRVRCAAVNLLVGSIKRTTVKRKIIQLFQEQLAKEPTIAVRSSLKRALRDLKMTALEY